MPILALVVDDDSEPWQVAAKAVEVSRSVNVAETMVELSQWQMGPAMGGWIVGEELSGALLSIASRRLARARQASLGPRVVCEPINILFFRA